ncbi:hypothetical protein F7R20_19635 [Pseudomonas brassicacearum subsp. brassicacearum]|nr:hypothetical protein F7R20_19635 [Pseudomonas brassicacearum subsp. brassicacearum]PJH88713.1 hypothetical protein CVG87_13665 [Pseudomonas sp. WCS365]
MLAIQAPRFQRDRVVFIAGKPCSHNATGPSPILIRKRMRYPARPQNTLRHRIHRHESRPHRTHR